MPDSLIVQIGNQRIHFNIKLNAVAFSELSSKRAFTTSMAIFYFFCSPLPGLLWIENRNQFEFVSLEQMVPQDHLLRLIDAAIDFNEVYEFVEDLYCKRQCASQH